jgi:hypothetical protein
MLVEVRSGYVKLGQFAIGYARFGHVRPGKKR